MRFLISLSKLLFLIVVLSIAILQLTGNQLLDAEWGAYATRLLLPAFFVLSGIVLCWILVIFFGNTFDPDEKSLTKGFFAGLIVGMCAAFLYLAWLSGTVSS